MLSNFYNKTNTCKLI